MKLKDIVSQLANRTNQPHVIEVYLRQVYAKGFVNGTKQSLWISVKDQLPDVGISVFVRTTNKKYVLTSMYIPTDCHGNVLGEKEWHGNGVFKGSITHWMPVPE